MQPERPGPLRDLPLEQFTGKANLSHAHSPFTSRPRIPSNKRPAPSESLPDGSPSKRRLLADERGIVASPLTSTLPFVHSTSIPTGFSDTDGSEAGVGDSDQAMSMETSVDLPWGHNGTTSAPGKPRRTSARLHAASLAAPLSTGSSLVPPPNLQSIPEHITGTSLSPRPSHYDSELSSTGCGSGSMHYPGFPIYHDSSAVPHGLLHFGNEPTLSRVTSSQRTMALDKENIPPEEDLAPSFVLKKKIRFMTPSPCTPVKSSLPSPLNCSTDHGGRNTLQITPLARSLQSTTLAQASMIIPEPTMGRRSSLGSPFLGLSSPRRMPLDRSERMSLRRQLTEEADGMDLH